MARNGIKEHHIHALHLKYKLPKNVLIAIVESQFSKAREELQSGTHDEFETFKNVRLRHLGIIVANKHKMKYLIPKK